jgi:catechol 2,3-dioxygenase-like lactoylglutathione lyase family enzyme
MMLPSPGRVPPDDARTPLRESPTMIRRLGHLCFVTDNLDRMVDFYTKGLGLKVKFSFTNADGQVFGHYLVCGDSTFIEIFDRVLKHKQWGGPLEPLRGGGQYQHFCFEVTALRDLKAALEARGVKVGEVATGMDHSLQAWTGDPDGNAIELMEYTSQSWQLQGSGARGTCQA